MTPKVFVLSFWFIVILIFLNLLISMIIEVYASVNQQVASERVKLGYTDQLRRSFKDASEAELIDRVQKVSDLLNIFSTQE